MLDPRDVSPDVVALNPDLFRQVGEPQPQQPSRLEEKFMRLWTEVDGPELVREYQFHPDRRWRFDFAHVPSKTAIEIEGGVWSHGRHTRGHGFIGDCTKYNAAAMRGWIVYRLPADLLTQQYAGMIAQHIQETE